MLIMLTIDSEVVVADVVVDVVVDDDSKTQKTNDAVAVLLCCKEHIHLGLCMAARPPCYKEHIHLQGWSVHGCQSETTKLYWLIGFPDN